MWDTLYRRFKMIRLLTALFLILTISAVKAENNNLALHTNDIRDHTVSSSINFILDLVLKHYRNKLIDEGRTKIQIADIDEKFSTKLLIVVVEAELLVNDGWLSNISTVQRTGDADLTRNGEEFTITAHLGLNELKIDYNNYDISILGAHQTGKIHVTVGANSLEVKIKFQLKPKCKVTLTEVKLEKLNDISVDITNLGPFENLTDELTSWIVNEVSMRFRNYIEQVMFPDVSNAIKEADICHYIPI